MSSLQKPYYLCNIVLIVTILLAAGCARRSVERPATTPIERPRPSTRTHRPPTAVPPRKLPADVPRIAQPTIRVGLRTDAKLVTISSEGAIQFSDGSRTRNQSNSVTASLSFSTTVSTQYYVQIGSYSSRENAEKAKREIRTRYPSLIFENPDLGQYQLRLGPFASQENAQGAVEELKSQSIQAFYISDTPPLSRLPELVVRDELGELLLKTNLPVEFWSSSKGVISVDNTPYRGFLSILVNSSGRLSVINVLSFEDYLKGVVPNEIGPASEGTYEALKAQAVAARTYAYKNRNQFGSEGYDICATPRCQVYSGYKTENAFTSRAVEDTSGEILEYGGEPINALYTSTCGGRTEDAEYMFEGWNYPYLKSVECYPEEEKISTRSVLLQGRKETWEGAWLNLKTGMQIQYNPEAPASNGEIESLMPSLLQSLGKNSCSTQSLASNHWSDVAEYLVASLCWQKKRDSLLDTKDYQYFVNRLRFSSAANTEIQSLLFLLHEEIVDLPQEERNFDPYSPIKRKYLWQMFYRVMKHYHQINTTEGMLREISRASMQLVDDLGVHSFPLKTNMYLYQKLGEIVTPHSEVNCAPGDQVEYLVDDQQQVILLVCEVDRSGISVDRSSKVTFWRESITPSELGKKVAKYLDVGDIVDLQPLSYGLSHRIYELKITGSQGSGTLRGIRVRWALGLKDNLFVIEKTFDRNGRVKEFVFTGRGWGHGVGMCQVGAIGFAKQGKDYKSILTHYYTGVQIKKEY